MTDKPNLEIITQDGWKRIGLSETKGCINYQRGNERLLYDERYDRVVDIYKAVNVNPIKVKKDG